ncbi:hypothetical protein CK203_000194 [Vitis vinifera]|uniref:Uncharacterized protein n=1 Tax=Vitis vinifera TaxID=29760 RepID=A0A438KPU3_VITVI|nr:hypothetical protein CK203_000194 [Vitis vinifera]
MSIMAEVVEVLADAEMSGSDHPKKSLKRKRISPVAGAPTVEDRKARIGALRAEMEGLFRYFEEASVVELVSEIYEKVKVRDNGGGVTLATVKSSAVLVGQRLAYGVPNADADVSGGRDGVVSLVLGGDIF